jgi:hypothetical protein
MTYPTPDSSIALSSHSDARVADTSTSVGGSQRVRSDFRALRNECFNTSFKGGVRAGLTMLLIEINARGVERSYTPSKRLQACEGIDDHRNRRHQPRDSYGTEAAAAQTCAPPESLRPN